MIEMRGTMKSDYNKTYTGKISYRDIDFTFVFVGDELRLIPPADKESEIERQWKMTSIGNGAYTFADPIPVDEKFIIADCNETNAKIIFLTKEGSYLGFRNSVIIIRVFAIVICKYNRDSFDRVTFSCPEINYIHPTNQAFSFSVTEELSSKGKVELNTREFSDTTTEKQSFLVDEKTVNVFFGISRKVSTKIDEHPLSLNSTLFFEFEQTNDYSFILRLHQIALDFIRFLCYRKNIYISEVNIAAPFKDGKHEPFATMFILNQQGETEKDVLKQGRYIKQIHFAGKEGEIFSDIASGSIYLRHIPESYQSGRHIDAARFVMITAAFEWEFSRQYPEGCTKSKATIDAEKDVSNEIQKLIEKVSGKRKKICKFIKRLIKSSPLQKEIIQIGKDYSNIIDVFGNHLYQINGEELKYSEMGQRLSDQRNHFAHGDLDKDFIGLSLLDLVFMEYVVYAMQLKYYNLSDIEIQRSINELFRCRLAI
jgi:predicted nucleic-acid-binding Zn-ribbon protein